MDGLYGKITQEQLNDFKKKLHGKIHWLLIYKEVDDFTVDFDAYYTELMNYIGSAGEVLRQEVCLRAGDREATSCRNRFIRGVHQLPPEAPAALFRRELQ